MSLHGVKSLACICSALLIQLHLPLHIIPHSMYVCSMNSREVGADTTFIANGANSSRDADFCSQYASTGV